jgi:hypothetical protein
MRARGQPVRPNGSPAARHMGGDNEWGRAIVLLGAGCSMTAGIPLASGVAERATVHLAERYGLGVVGGNATDALRALIDADYFPSRFGAEAGGPHWGPLYTYIFSDHIKHPVEQRRFIGSLIRRDGVALNWAHVCLGALVKERFVHTILTTNFDQLALQSVIRTGIVPVVADGLESLNRISPTPDWPQVVHLHGSMHTYELRNSQEALRETEQDRGLQVMMMSLLREASVLLVVGYAGGEEGIMALLRYAAEALPRMVVYWIAYEDDYAKFSPHARGLLQVGENKFFISGQDADEFFNGLIGELGIGAPEWIKHPLRVLERQAEIAVAAKPSENVRRIVEAYKARVAQAVAREIDKDDPVEQAAFHLSARRYDEAVRALAGTPYQEDPALLRMYALGLHRRYDNTADPDPELLRMSVLELERLFEMTDGSHPEDVQLLIEAYRDTYELADLDQPGRAALPGKILAVAERCQAKVDPREDPRAWAMMSFYRGEAAQLDAELRDASGGERAYDEASRRHRLSLAREAYQEALDGLARADAPRARECKEGLAGALIGLAELDEDHKVRSSHLREAQGLFREVVEFARINTPDERYAGAIENLVNALRSSRKYMPADAPLTRQEERRLLALALDVYQNHSAVAGVRRVRELLADLSY